MLTSRDLFAGGQASSASWTTTLAQGVTDMPRPTQALISLGALRHNIMQVRARVGARCKILMAVKADAYGHGAVPVSRLARDLGVEMLGVAMLEEGIELREAGIQLPILVLGQLLADDADAAVAHDLTVSVADRALAQALATAAMKRETAARVFVNIDTGMGRVGVHPYTDAVAVVSDLLSVRNLSLDGVFSHFPASDETDKSLAREQVRRLMGIRRSLETQGLSIPIFSMANSAAIFDLPEAYLDMVRPGIMIYGSTGSPCVSDALQLRQAMTLRSAISFLKRVRKGTTLGYGMTYTVPVDDALIATVPIGYADGYSRALSNRAPVLINGERYRVSGRVSMDQITVDLGPTATAQVGDDVVLFGTQADAHIAVEEIAELIGTIVHEVTCGVSKRVPRVWTED